MKRVLGSTLLVLALAAAPAAAQMAVPDTFTNLKVLPKNITKPQLLGTMRAFSGALGVRCDYCHARSEASGGRPAATPATPPPGAPAAPGAAGPGGPPEQLNFASDAKAQKRIARGMLQMVGGINREYLARIADLDSATRVQVQCVTCHHGVAIPRPLADVLMEDIGDKGVAGAVADYGKLKAQYYGSGAYDFREGSLEEVARQLAAANKPDDALAILDLAAQEYPQSGNVAFMQGETLLQKGDKPAALARFKRALELQPQNPMAKRRVAELQGSQ